MSGSWSYFFGHVPLTERTPLIATTTNEQTNPKAKEWSQVALVLIVALLSETARGIVMPTLAPYVISLGGDGVMIGYVNSIFSLGRFTATIGLGYLSTRSYKAVLVGSLAVCVIGNTLYGFTSFGGIPILLISRFITGFGCGSLSAQRAYIAHVTTPEERTPFMSILGGVQYLGFAVMPAAGSLLLYLPTFDVFGVTFDKYTTPGYLLSLLSLMVFFMLIFLFTNPPPLPTQPNKSEPLQLTPEAQSSNSMQKISTPPLTKTRKELVFVVFLVLNFMARLVLGIIETIGTPVYMELDEHESTSRREAEAGFLFGGFGIAGMGVLFLLYFLSKRVADLKVLLVGLSIYVLGMGLLIADLTKIRFAIGCALVWSVGAPLTQTLVVSMYSKSIGEKPQGTWMGWIGGVGSMGRIIGPTLTGFLWENFGQSATMAYGTSIIGFSLLLSLLLIRKEKNEVHKEGV